VQTLVQKDLDRSDGGVAEAGGERGAELAEFDVVEPVLEPSLLIGFVSWGLGGDGGRTGARE